MDATSQLEVEKTFDIFGGRCPKCDKQLDNPADFKDHSGIPTRMFSCPSWRKFYPSDFVPKRMNASVLIGFCPHCNTPIKANFIPMNFNKIELTLWHQSREANLRDRFWSTNNPMPADSSILADYSEYKTD